MFLHASVSWSDLRTVSPIAGIVYSTDPKGKLLTSLVGGFQELSVGDFLIVWQELMVRILVNLSNLKIANTQTFFSNLILEVWWEE